jgi:hypothetical protein
MLAELYMRRPLIVGWRGAKWKNGWHGMVWYGTGILLTYIHTYTVCTYLECYVVGATQSWAADGTCLSLP